MVFRLQTAVEEEKRGRVMGLYSMAVSGMTPFGNLLAGWLASHIGAVETVFAGGLICLCGGLLYFNRLPEIRSRLSMIYR
ncbi:MAG: MFS transporter [Bacillota bacterium]